MRKIKMLLFLTFLSLLGYSQDIFKNKLEVLDSLVCMNDIKSLKENKKELGIYLIRGKNSIDYLAIECPNMKFYNDFYYGVNKYYDLKRLEGDGRMELVKSH